MNETRITATTTIFFYRACAVQRLFNDFLIIFTAAKPSNSGAPVKCLTSRFLQHVQTRRNISRRPPLSFSECRSVQPTVSGNWVYHSFRCHWIRRPFSVGFVGYNRKTFISKCTHNYCLIKISDVFRTLFEYWNTRKSKCFSIREKYWKTICVYIYNAALRTRMLFYLTSLLRPKTTYWNLFSSEVHVLYL